MRFRDENGKGSMWSVFLEGGGVRMYVGSGVLLELSRLLFIYRHPLTMISPDRGGRTKGGRVRLPYRRGVGVVWSLPLCILGLDT